MLTSRIADGRDVAAVEGIVHAAYAHYVERIGVTPAPMRADHRALIGRGSVRLAERDGVPVGVLVLDVHADHVLVENVAVSPEEQGRGVGSLLLDLAEREAAARGIGEIRLYTNEAMTENLAYYPRRGFTETHRAVDHGFRRVFFRKLVAAHHDHHVVGP